MGFQVSSAERVEPAALIQLSKTFPFKTAGGHLPAQKKLLESLTLSIDDIREVIPTVDATASATLIRKYIHRRHYELIFDEDEDVEYDDTDGLWEQRYEDDWGDQKLYISDVAQNFFKVCDDLAPPLEVLLKLVHEMARIDRDRHKEIDEHDADSARYDFGEGGFRTSYKRFLGSKKLIKRWFGESFDFMALDASERKMFLVEIARFNKSELKREWLEFALRLVQQLVEPLKTSAENAAEIAADVQEVCRVLTEKPAKKEKK